MCGASDNARSLGNISQETMNVSENTISDTDIPSVSVVSDIQLIALRCRQVELKYH